MADDLCEYEKQRMENVKRNHAKLVELGLEAPVREKPIKKRRVTSHAPKMRERRGSPGVLFVLLKAVVFILARAQPGAADSVPQCLAN